MKEKKTRGEGCLRLHGVVGPGESSVCRRLSPSVRRDGALTAPVWIQVAHAVTRVHVRICAPNGPAVGLALPALGLPTDTYAFTHTHTGLNELDLIFATLVVRAGGRAGERAILAALCGAGSWDQLTDGPFPDPVNARVASSISCPLPDAPPPFRPTSLLRLTRLLLRLAPS